MDNILCRKEYSKNSISNIMLVDDHPVVIQGLKNILKTSKNINIIADACDGKEALSVLKNKDIDLVITDISMPKIDGIELTKKIKELYPKIKVILLTVYDDNETLMRAFHSGAEACLLKNTSKKKFIEIILRVINNETYYCKEVMSILKNNLSKTSNLKNLSKRESEIFALLIEGYSNKKISEKLSISYNTVRTHRRNIMKKTNCSNFCELFRLAL